MREVGLSVSGKLAKRLFSCPENSSELGGDDGVVEFPESVVLLKTRLTGLFGESRVARKLGLAEAAFGLPERRESLSPDRKGVERWDCEYWCDSWGADAGGIGLCMMRQGDGEFGDEGQLVFCDVPLTILNFEGDLDKERLNDRTAVVTSTW